MSALSVLDLLNYIAETTNQELSYINIEIKEQVLGNIVHFFSLFRKI